MLRVPGSVADGDIGAFFHQLIFREEEQQILSEGILCYKVKKKKKSAQSDLDATLKPAPSCLTLNRHL